MGRFLRFGCLGIVGLAILGGIGAAVGGSKPAQQQVVTGQAPSSPGTVSAANATSGPQIAQIGQTIALGGWEVTLMDFGPYERFSPSKPSATKAQGRLVVVDLKVKNLQNSTSNFSQNDFLLKASDGREFKPAGQTATIERGFMISQTVQPGLVTENRVVFDVDPAVTSFTFTALKMLFAVSVS